MDPTEAPTEAPAEAEARADIVAEARTWLRTPYHHRALVKGVGVDCAQLPIGVWSGAGLIESFDTGDYPSDWHLHRQEERYLGFVLRYAGEIEAREAQPGDLVLFKFGRAYSHGAILIGPGVAIHASRKDRCVCLVDIDRDVELVHQPRRYFSYWAHQARSSSERPASVSAETKNGR